MKKKIYTSHSCVNVGDLVILKCTTLPQNKIYAKKNGHTQKWTVIKIEKNAVVLSSEKYKTVKIHLHDSRINNGQLSLNYNNEIFIFTIFYKEQFKLSKYITNIFSFFKRNKEK